MLALWRIICMNVAMGLRPIRNMVFRIKTILTRTKLTYRQISSGGGGGRGERERLLNAHHREIRNTSSDRNLKQGKGFKLYCLVRAVSHFLAFKSQFWICPEGTTDQWDAHNLKPLRSIKPPESWVRGFAWLAKGPSLLGERQSPRSDAHLSQYWRFGWWGEERWAT